MASGWFAAPDAHASGEADADRARAAWRATAPASCLLEPVPPGGFRLVAPDGALVEAGPIGEQSAAVVLPAAGVTWRLSMPRGHQPDARLEDGTDEIGRSLRRDRAGSRSSWTILLWDGRLFTVDAGRDGRLEVRGWEAPGAYLEAMREERGWRIVRTIAGRDLAGGLVLTVLLASELARLEDDDPHVSS